MTISKNMIFGLAISFSLLTAAEQVPASIDIIQDDTAPVVSKDTLTTDSSTASVALAPVAKNEAPSMVVQEPPTPIKEPSAITNEKSSTSQARIQSKPEPIIIKLSERPVRQPIVIESEAPSRTDVDELRNYYPITLDLAISASLGSATFNTSDSNMPNFSGLYWNAGAIVIVPLNESSIGMVSGALFNWRNTSAVLNENTDNERYSFSQMSIDIPLYFKFKRSRSRLAFDTGIQMSVNIYDKLEISSKNYKEEFDLMDASYRSPIDWSLIGGFSIVINTRASFKMHLLIGLSDLYNTPEIEKFSTDFALVEASMGLIVKIL